MKTIYVDLSNIEIPKTKILFECFESNYIGTIQEAIHNGFWASCLSQAAGLVYKRSLREFWTADSLFSKTYRLSGVYNEQGARLIIYYMEKLAENGKDFDFFLDNIIWMVKRTEMIRNPEVVVKICLGMENEKCKL